MVQSSYAFVWKIKCEHNTDDDDDDDGNDEPSRQTNGTKPPHVALHNFMCENLCYMEIYGASIVHFVAGL